jgi:CDP-glucose 4,6-dehydratase
VGQRQGSLETVGLKPNFWREKKVLVTGHTGFKGSWLSLWLQNLGADLVGYALSPPTAPSLFEVADVGAGMTSILGDVRDLERLVATVEREEPEIVFHLAAQALLLPSYRIPVETYATNVMGTVHLLEAVRRSESVRVVVNVTSDKCYENRDEGRPYREDDALGGRDPYSSSKGCGELVTSAYRNSFFSSDAGRTPAAIATARAGNAVGGGDWAPDRLVPDIIEAFRAGRPAKIRNPDAVRPWQHVLDPLFGYLLLAEKLWDGGHDFAEAWNFGPGPRDLRTVESVVERVKALWGGAATWEPCRPARLPEAEAARLQLDSAKARTRLGWSPRLPLDESLAWTVRWYTGYASGADMRSVTESQISRYERGELSASP